MPCCSTPTAACSALARNEREKLHDPTAHAEVLAIRRGAEARGDWRLTDTTLVVTLEPVRAVRGRHPVRADPARGVRRLGREGRARPGSVHDLLRDRRLNHRVEVLGGVLEAESGALLTAFFRGEAPMRPSSRVRGRGSVGALDDDRVGRRVAVARRQVDVGLDVDHARDGHCRADRGLDRVDRGRDIREPASFAANATLRATSSSSGPR